MNEQLNQLRLPPEAKARPRGGTFAIFAGVLLATATAGYFAWPRASDEKRLKNAPTGAALSPKTSTPPATSASTVNPPPTGNVKGSLLTVSGYIVNRERIEISPRFMGVVKWIGVKKGDAVTNGQVVVLLDDAEYRAREVEMRGHVATMRANLEKAETAYTRTATLAKNNIESKQIEDDARITVEAAKAAVVEAEGQQQLIRTYIDWCTIKSPINGVVLEKLVDPNELVTPQSFGGTRGPSTALIAVADLKDLQVEIDLNEADVAKVALNQPCKVSPEAYPERSYDGYVAEKAPEANRQKGTLQVKVQIKNPDEFLTPELSAKVDFLATQKP